MASAHDVSSRPTTEQDITDEAVRRVQASPDPRVREVMTSLIKHLHAFLTDVQLTEAEWWTAIGFLTRTGQISNERRQEFILLSDTLGASMVTDLINHRKPTGATESTVFGPFHRDGAPERGWGESVITTDRGGTTAMISGRVLSLDGKPIANAELDVWQVAEDRLYDSQDESLDEMNMRGKFRTNAQGQYLVKTTRPVYYAIPDDGPVGDMLKATGRHPYRPPHVHFVVAADGYEPVTTHIFDSKGEYLDGDAVFGVKNSLIADFVLHDKKDAAAELYRLEPPFYTCEFDFVLAPVKK